MTKQERQEKRLTVALHLIKKHIGAEETNQNRDLHEAVQVVVDFAREEGYLRQ